MRNVSKLVLVIAGVTGCLLWPSAVFAMDPGTVTINSIVSQVKGQIVAGGTYTAQKGWTVSSITLYAWPDKGGVKVKQGANLNNGNWSATINGLQPGVLYDVQADMELTMNGVLVTVASTIVKVTVAAQ